MTYLTFVKWAFCCYWRAGIPNSYNPNRWRQRRFIRPKWVVSTGWAHRTSLVDLPVLGNVHSVSHKRYALAANSDAFVEIKFERVAVV